LQCWENTNWLPRAKPARAWPSSRSRALILRFACASAARLYRGADPLAPARPDRAAFG